MTKRMLTFTRVKSYIYRVETEYFLKVFTFHPVECQYAFCHIWAYFLQFFRDLCSSSQLRW